jgi:hypothetical protein
MSLTPSLEELEKHRTEQERARDLGLGYAVLRHIILQANSDAEDGISMGRAVELIREMALRAVDKAVAEDRAAVVAWLRRNPGVSRGPECVTAMTPFESAEAIERGEHRREEKP